MKNSILALIILSCTLIACNSNAADQNSGEQETVYFSEEDFLNNQQQNSNFRNQNVQQTNSNWSNQSNTSTYGGGIKNVIIPNPQTGRPMIHMPVPTSWQNSQKGFTGPNGLRAAEMAEMGYQSQMNEALVSSREVIQGISQELVKTGFSLTNTYNLPSIAQCRKQMDNQQWKATAMNTNFTTTGIEGISPKREKVLIIVSHQTSQSQGFQYWGMDVQMLTSNENYFEEGKKALIYALSNLKYDQQYIAQANQQGARSNQAHFEKRNNAMVGANNEVNRLSREAYRNNSESQDRMMQSQVQSIYERSTVQDPNSGQNWEVEGQAQQYWVDQFGNYIPSNNVNWNPNTDPNYNNSQWTKAQNPNGGNW